MTLPFLTDNNCVQSYVCYCFLLSVSVFTFPFSLSTICFIYSIRFIVVQSKRSLCEFIYVFKFWISKQSATFYVFTIRLKNYMHAIETHRLDNFVIKTNVYICCLPTNIQPLTYKFVCVCVLLCGINKEHSHTYIDTLQSTG